MCGWNRSTQPLPRALAAYIAVSAQLMRSSAVVGSVPENAIPMLTRTRTCWSAVTKGTSSASSRRWATASACPSSVMSSSSTPNSSPPRRAAVSPSRRHVMTRSATSTSRRSPASCPRRSLTSLKPSRSQYRTATMPVAAALVQRLDQPVGEHAPVVQPGQCVVAGEVDHLVGEPAAVERGDPDGGERLERLAVVLVEPATGQLRAHHQVPGGAALDLDRRADLVRLGRLLAEARGGVPQGALGLHAPATSRSGPRPTSRARASRPRAGP